MKLSDIKIALSIASRFLKTKKISIKSVGEGSNNKNFLAKSGGQEIVIKLSHPHKEYKALEDYAKEKWCIQRSAVKGVPGPAILDLGTSLGRAYMIETFVPGRNGKRVKDRIRIWHEIGRYTKLIHKIQASGFGEKLVNPSRGLFRGSWQKYLGYNIKSLNEKDKLLQLKVFKRDQLNQIKSIFQSLKKQKFTFGLNHGDVSIWNTLVENSGKVNFLDWGSAEVGPIPHYDFIHVMRCQMESGKPTSAEFASFLKGYGVSKKRFKDLRPQLFKLMLLISFDKLRWALDRNPSKIQEFTKRAKRMVKLNLP